MASRPELLKARLTAKGASTSPVNTTLKTWAVPSAPVAGATVTMLTFAVSAASFAMVSVWLPLIRSTTNPAVGFVREMVPVSAASTTVSSNTVKVTNPDVWPARIVICEAESVKSPTSKSVTVTSTVSLPTTATSFVAVTVIVRAARTSDSFAVAALNDKLTVRSWRFSSTCPQPTLVECTGDDFLRDLRP